MKISTLRPLSLLSLTLVLATPLVARGQSIGTSCADCPSLSAAFSIENKTGVTIRYQVKWGDDGPWKSVTLETNHVETHTFPLDGRGRAPGPHVKYDRIGGDGAFTPKVYHLGFYAVGYSGYGGRANNKEPKKYYFEYAADHRTLNFWAF
jgi:hypothetical protein